MNQELIEMARQAGITMSSQYGAQWEANTEDLEAFAALVAAAEREACAKLCDYVYDNIVTDEHIKDMAFKIRARGETK
jgi:hypothetical protein